MTALGHIDIDDDDDDNKTMLLKTIPTARGGSKSPEDGFSLLVFFLLFKLLGKVFRTMTITKGLWGKTMDQKFEIGTPLLMRKFLSPFSSTLEFFVSLFSLILLASMI